MPVRELIKLADYMKTKKYPVNLGIFTKQGDVDHLALLDNGEGWEAVNETGTYDLWFKDELKFTDLSLKEAAGKLLMLYETSKVARVGKRLINKN